MKYTQQGRSMVEMLGVLAIIGVLSVAGIAGYSMAMNRYRTTQIKDQVQTLSLNIRTLYSAQGTYEGLDIDLLVTLGALDRSVCRPGDGFCLNGFPNGQMTIDTLGDNESQFSLTYTNLPRNTCVAIAMANWGGAASGFAGMDVNADSRRWADNDEMPFTMVDAVGACDTDASNEIMFVFQ